MNPLVSEEPIVAKLEKVLDTAKAHALAEAAHQVCPYSRATRGNIDIAINVV